ncbi:MFS transporter [Nocardioides sp.]|uniref:MFS transporter n=1 Tax=Nocardioides sp. TaxID=35761 RepID=UPI002ED97D55
MTFLVFFQAYMVAPLIPRLATVFAAPPTSVGLAVPAYLIPYGCATLVYGILSDRVGRARVMLASLAAFLLFVPLTATAGSVRELIAWRVAAGLGASGIVPIALALVGDLYPYEQRGRPLGWLFGAMAGGMAVGAPLGALLEPAVGWRGVFLMVGVLTVPVAVVLLRLLRRRDRAGAGAAGAAHQAPPRATAGTPSAPRPLTATLRELGRTYGLLLAPGRGLGTYAFVFLNGVFHSGVFTWLGLYLSQRYGLAEVGIGLALLGYGVPGLLLGPVIGRAADRWGRRWLIPAGIGLAATAALVLTPDLPLALATVAIVVLSLGYDMTQPLLAGIVTRLGTALGGGRGGQAMGLNVFLLFTGSGLGSLIFGSVVAASGLASALLAFGAVQLVAGLLAVPLFRDEQRQHAA